MDENTKNMKSQHDKIEQERELKQKQADETLHKLVKGIDEHPHDYKTYYELGAFLVELHNYTQAEELMMKALGLFADRSKKAKNTLLYGLGNVYYSAGDFDKAIEQFSKVNDDKLKFDAYMMLAQSYMSKDDYKRAVVFALTAQGMRRQNPDINYILGESLIALGNFKEAAGFLDAVIKADSKNGKAYFERGLTAMMNDEDFNDYFVKAKEYDPKYFEKSKNRLADIEKFIKAKQK
ncbi:tetratricopeptide repeat protein [Apilactobacillus xinyiensis]|uniref:tetratricopeptide repeat protein n=1 Tax=Apilactobacillus xinyiensis TaxID=2841032 RepID=UPI00200CE8D4|nr:tetratricopeptide repeat protein [Apilactobacillus xinyiensis]MCL0329908.1 tetratricopeptide repeat protein [Apilactobacillus xinyiensis]